MTQLTIVLSALFNAVVLGFISRRLLGVPVGWPRTILVSLAVSTAFEGFVRYLALIPGLGALGRPGADVTGPGNTLQTLLIIGLSLSWVLAIGLAILVILEAIVPTGTLPRPIAWVRGMGGQRRRTRRYAEIIAIAVRHGLGGYLRGRSPVPTGEPTSKIARSLREALSDGGVTFVKLGQMLATRPDLIGPDFTRELSRLQSQVAPGPWSAVEPVLVGELGRPVDEVFADVDRTPIAAASVAQVHAATLHDGSAVVVKVQRPDARRQVTGDLDIVLRLARWLDRTTVWGRNLGVLALAEGFAASLEEELDYTVELGNMRAVEAGLAAGDAIVVPAVHAHLSGPRLLVMERMTGQPVAEAGALLSALTAEQRHDMAQRLLRTVLRQIVVTGVFHADLHQGNIFVFEDGRLAMLDLGSVGRLDEGARTGLGRLLHAVDRNDSIGATDALLDVLDRPDVLDDRFFEREVGQLVQRSRTGFGASGSAGMFGALVTVIIRHRFSVPPQVAASFRALAALEGTLGSISPGFDLVASARVEGRTMLGDQLRPERVRATLEDQLVTLLPLVQRLPRRINAITDNLERGRTSFNVRLLADERDRGFITGILQQLTMTILAAACAVCGILLVTSESGPLMLPQLRLYTFLGATLFFFAFVLAARSLVLVFRHTATQPSHPTHTTWSRR